MGSAGISGPSERMAFAGVWKYYVSEVGNDNISYEYGVHLSQEKKDELVEYLKTL
jgi:hypothetical protein